jgi:hypothetical protein
VAGEEVLYAAVIAIVAMAVAVAGVGSCGRVRGSSSKHRK